MSLATEIKEIQKLARPENFSQQKEFAKRYNEAIERGIIEPPTYKLATINSNFASSNKTPPSLQGKWHKSFA